MRFALPSPTLADEVIRLEPLDERFIPDFERLAADPEVVRFTRVPTEPDQGFAAAWIGRYVSGWADGSRAGFAIVGEADSAFLGMAALVEIQSDWAEGELGYIVAPAARGRGVAGRAIRLLAHWSFEELG